jgi:hypothetical protein
MQQQEIDFGYRLSPQQRRVWALSRSTSAYCAQAVWLIDGDFEF